MRDPHTAERLRRRTIDFLAEPHPWGIDEDEHPTRLDPVEAELEHAVGRIAEPEPPGDARPIRP